MRFISYNRLLYALLISLSAVCLSGCSFFLPAHSHSYDLEEQSIQLRLLTREEFCKLEADINNNREPRVVVFDKECATGNEFGPALIAAPALAAAGNFAMDWVKKQIEHEASLYEAEFKKEIAKGSFWKVDEGQYSMNYAGFELVRRTKNYDDHTGPKVAFRLVAKFDEAPDSAAFLIKPVYLVDNATKAKVLAKYSPIAWFNWFTKASETVDINIAVEMKAIWTNPQQITKIDPVAAFTFDIESYDLNQTPELLIDSKELQDIGGWFQGVPVSSKLEDPKTLGTGNFWLKVTVTEKDTSNAKRYLTEMKDYADKNQDTLVNSFVKTTGAKSGL